MRARLAALGGGIVAVGSKELRGRMRGPRAFVALTLYLALLAAFTVMIYLLQQQSAAEQAAFGGGSPYVAAQVGQAIFTTLLFLQVLLVVFLAPAATSGAISLEREKQTLDLLTATPVSTLAIVLGKLASALAFVVILVVASIPLTAVVFVFGGVAPEDILRGYVVLVVTALGFGSLGILVSAATRRTQSATVLAYLGVLVLVVGTGFAWFFWDQMAGSRPVEVAPAGPLERPKLEGAVDDVAPTPSAAPAVPRPPEALLWLNPVVAAADVICGTDVDPYSTACQLIGSVTGTTPGVGSVTISAVPMPDPLKAAVDLPAVAQPGGGVAGAWGPAPGDGAALAAEDPFGSASTRDSFWPKAAAAWLVMAALFVLLAVQLVSPTRRWHLPRRRQRGGGA
jgi:ABC-type transport system involved in multi-copper enzyme maturation permease subunit